MPRTRLRTLVYKRTHKGDPDEAGRWGIRDCMGRIRDFEYNAVIGIGGLGQEAVAEGIDGQVNWIGIGPRKKSASGKRGSLVTFERFILFHDGGPDFRTEAPALAKRMYAKHGPRFLLDSFSSDEQAELRRLLALVPKSSSEGTRKQGQGMQKKPRSRCAVPPVARSRPCPTSKSS